MPKQEFSINFSVTEYYGNYAAKLGDHLLDSERQLAHQILTACGMMPFKYQYTTKSEAQASVAVGALRHYGLSVNVDGFTPTNSPDNSVTAMHHLRAKTFTRELDIRKDEAGRDRARRFAKNAKSELPGTNAVYRVDDPFAKEHQL